MRPHFIRSIDVITFAQMFMDFKIVFIFFVCISSMSAQHTIATRYPCPHGFSRNPLSDNSFGQYLRDLPLKPIGSKVLYFNGQEKANHNANNSNVYVSVINLPIGRKDLHQCADAIMRLRAEYLYNSRQYKDIHFNFTNGFRCDYSKWKDGYRVKVSKNKTNWIKTNKDGTDYAYFKEYLDVVYMYAGTASLSKELNSVSINDLQIGDVFIKGGYPGHAVIVVDKATNKEGRVVYMLAQSYMPAQELQLLANPNSVKMNPWYELSIANDIVTPEWTFSVNQLKRFVN